MEDTTQNQPKEKIEWEKLFLGLALTILVLIIIVPLLTSANPIFKDYVTNALKIFDIITIINWLNWFLKNVFSAITFWRLVWVGLLWTYLPKAITYLHKIEFLSEPNNNDQNNHNLPLFIPKVSTIVVLAVFFVSQLQIYLSSTQTLASLGYSYGKYANEVFGQLSVVALVVFNLVFFDKFYKGRSLITSLVLILEGFFLLFIGFKSDFDYISVAGLTFKRLYGLAILLWLAGLYLGFVYMLQQQKSHNWYLRLISVFSILVVLGVNIANFDYLIYHVNPPRETTGVAYNYFSELSSDADFDASILDNMARYTDGTNKLAYRPEMLRTVEYIKYLQNKYNKAQLQSFNLSEFNQYLKVRDINLARYNQLLYRSQNEIEQTQESLESQKGDENP